MSTVRLPPSIMMSYLITINLLIYIDRGAIGAVLSNLSSDSEMNLNGMEAGILGSVFMLGFVLSSPLFAHYALTIYPMFLMALGLLFWSLATVAAGLAVDYWMLLIARACTGIGEASFICLAPPYILDIAPAHRKTLWVAMFYSAIILGYAIGFVYGQQVMDLLGSWRWPFLIESAAMLPFILLAIFLERDSNFMPQSEEEPRPSFAFEMRCLCYNRVFVFVVFGSAVVTFTIGGLAFWGNSLLEDLFDISEERASLTFGTLTLGCGLFAVLIGSVLMDLVLQPAQKAFNEGSILDADFERQRTKIACCFALGATIGGAAFGTSCVFVARFTLFVLLLGGAEFMIFLAVGPVGVAIMSCVPRPLRGQANAVSAFFMHMLGDFPSPFIIGVMKDEVGLKWALLGLALWMLVGAGAWVSAFRYKDIASPMKSTDADAKQLLAEKVK